MTLLPVGCCGFPIDKMHIFTVTYIIVRTVKVPHCRSEVAAGNLSFTKKPNDSEVLFISI